MTADIDVLEEQARRCRVEIVKMVHRAQAGHPGGSLSEIDLLVGLYGGILRVRPDDPDWEDRDRFILSKGHASPGMYAVLLSMGSSATRISKATASKEAFVRATST